MTESAPSADFRLLKVAQSLGFKIVFTVDVAEEAALPEITEVVENFVRTDSGVHNSFIHELQAELKRRNAPVPVELRTLQPQSANSEVWLRGSASYFKEAQQHSEKWIIGEWGSCLGSCGTSMQNRSVECSSKDATICAGAGMKPPLFRECKHPSPCPDTPECSFGCSPQWWIVVIVCSTLILTCFCACVYKVRQARAKQEHNIKAIATTPAFDIFAYVNAQGARSAAPDTHTAGTQVEAPTLLRSVTQAQVKCVAGEAPDAIVSLAEIELGDAGKQSCETDASGAVTNDLDQWLANCDFTNVKIPTIPRVIETEAGDLPV